MNNAFFLIRQHKSTPFRSLSDATFSGKNDAGRIYEENVSLTLHEHEVKARRIVIRLNKPTRDGETEIGVFTNLPFEDVDASKVASIYKERWGIETAFQKLENYLNSEINTLGYPKAALFGFCVALVAFNLYAVVMAAIRCVHPDKNINEEVSDYYIAEEVSTISGGMSIAVPEIEWGVFRDGIISEVVELLLYLTRNIDLKKFKKHKRGAKKAPMPKDQFKGQPHVSTAKLLAAKNQAKAP